MHFQYSNVVFCDLESKLVPAFYTLISQSLNNYGWISNFLISCYCHRTRGRKRQAGHLMLTEADIVLHMAWYTCNICSYVQSRSSGRSFLFQREHSVAK